LPLLLVAVAVVLGLRSRTSPAGAADGLRTVKVVGLIHYGLTLRGVVQLAQELLTMRAMGVPESFVNLVACSAALIVNPLLGFAFRRRHPRGRWFAIAWYALLSTIGIGITYWLVRYRVAVDPARWPDDLVGKGMPLFLLFVMFLPRIKRAFKADAGLPKAQDPKSVMEKVEPVDTAPSLSKPRRGTIIDTVCVSLLIVVISTLVVDVADWTRQLLLESDY
jgi:hypothetical protein